MQAVHVISEPIIYQTPRHHPLGPSIYILHRFFVIVTIHLSVSTFKFYLKILFKKFHSNAQGITQLLRCRLAHETDRMERETLAEPYRHRCRANAANGTVEGRALLQPCTRSIGGGVLHLRSYVRFLEERWRGCNRRLRCCC